MVPAVASGVGRPHFLIERQQLEYLTSLGFSWSRVAILLGVSRMTVYRYVLFFFIIAAEVKSIED